MTEDTTDASGPLNRENAAPVLSLSPTPLLELPLEIWLEIFQFATHIPRSTSLRPSNPFTTRRVSSWNNIMAQNTPLGSLNTKVALTRVCKSWRAHALPLLYQHITIKSPKRGRLILQCLTESRQRDDPLGRGQWTRHIEVLTHARGSDKVQYLQNVFGILRCCPNLRVLSGTWNHPLPPQFLDAIIKLYGSGLEELYWNEIASQGVKRTVNTLTTVANLDFLGAFTTLQTLDLRHFKAGTPADVSTTRPTLPRVRDLIISTNPWSITAASGIVLPSLRSLTVKITRAFVQGMEDTPSERELMDIFLKAHGLSLDSVDIYPASPDDDLEQYSLNAPSAKPMDPGPFLNPDACPNLTSLCYPVDPEFLPLPNIDHPSLRRIGLRNIKSDFLAITRDKPDHVAKDHLQALYNNTNHYSNLELVQTIGLCVGKSSTKDVFIWWAEHFSRQGILLLDGEGVFWEYEEAVPKQTVVQGVGSSRVWGFERIVCRKMMD